MVEWVRFSRNDQTGFGILEEKKVISYAGDMFFEHQADGEVYDLSEVTLECPAPSQALILGIWNNFPSVAGKQGLPTPKHPWYFIKPPSCLLGPNRVIVQPESYIGPVIYEAELAVVIGRSATNVSLENASDYVFGYTAINDVTAVKIIREEDGYEQWCRSKGFDKFGPCGPTIRTDFAPQNQIVQAFVNGEERQNYLLSDMFFSPLELVVYLSKCQTLRPGDMIACGTALGAKSMKNGDEVDIKIEGLRTLNNSYQTASL